MRTSLSKIMMSDFIECACGNYRVLLEEGEKATDKELANAAAKMQYEYRKIVNPSEVKSVIVGEESSRKRHIRKNALTLCRAAAEIEVNEELLEILVSLGVRCTAENAAKKIDSELRRIDFEEKREQSKQPDESKTERTEEDVRGYYDKEQAALMAFYKMTIDLRTTTAAVYANLVASADRQMRARKSQLAKYN